MHDEQLKYETNEDLNYINRKIYVRYGVKLFRIILIILLITYFAGQYWIIFVQVMCLFQKDDLFKEEFGHGSIYLTDKLSNYSPHFSFLKNDNVDFTQYSAIEETWMAMYYALTTLSTVGFGDIYPVTNTERLICGFLMISGVLIFSYVLT